MVNPHASLALPANGRTCVVRPIARRCRASCGRDIRDARGLRGHELHPCQVDDASAAVSGEVEDDVLGAVADALMEDRAPLRAVVAEVEVAAQEAGAILR